MKFMTYLNKRGGRITLADVKSPEKNDWGTAEDAMVAALNLEKDVNGVFIIKTIMKIKIDYIYFSAYIRAY